MPNNRTDVTLDDKETPVEGGVVTPGNSGHEGRGDRKPRKAFKHEGRRHSQRGSNDASWYKKNALLFSQAAHVSTAHINGLPYGETAVTNATVKDTGRQGSKVMVCGTIITCGHSESHNDAFNQCMINQFNYIRGKYTSSVPFQANDLGCYYLAVGNILAGISSIRRALNAVNLYSKNDAQVAQLLLRAMGFTSYSTECSAYASNLFNLNTQIARLESLALPRDVVFFKRCSWLTSYYYYDSAVGGRANYYMYDLEGLYQFSSTVATHDGDGQAVATGLIYNSGWRTTTISTRITQLANAINALVSDDNARQISGWLTQYYKDYVFTSSYAVAETALPVFNDEVQYQFRNIRCIAPAAWSNINICQDVGEQSLYYPLSLTPGKMSSTTSNDLAYMPITDGYLMSYSCEPTDDMIMVGTRMTPAVLQTEGDLWHYETDLIIPTSLNVTYNASTQAAPSLATSKYMANTSTVSEQYPYTFKETIEAFASVNLAPMIRIGNWTKNSTTGIYSYTVTSELYDKQYNFYIAANNLMSLNQVAILSQFGLPSNGENSTNSRD
jgi:hypothetical protein